MNGISRIRLVSSLLSVYVSSLFRKWTAPFRECFHCICDYCFSSGKSRNILYHLNGKEYIIVPKIKIGFLPFSHVNDEKGKDVTETVIKYYGPGKDFHGCDITPSVMGFNKLVFFMNTGETLLFEYGEPISLRRHEC